MAFQVDMSPLTRSSMNIGSAISDIGQSIGQGIQQRQLKAEQEQEQGDIEALMRQAMSGDPVALKELMIKSPQAAQQVAQYLQQQMAGDQAETDRFQGEIANNTANFIEQMHAAPLEQQEAMFNANIDNPMVDIDEEDRGLFMNNNYRKAIIGRVKGNDYAESFFGKPVDLDKKAQLNIKQEELNIKKLEAREKALDRKLQRETNELKKSELKQKIQQTKTDKDKKLNQINVEGEQSVADIDSTIAVANEIFKHKGLDAAVGGTSAFPTMPGSDAADFEAKLEQFQSKQFLTNIEKMKGMGALSEAEGKKIASAAGALELNMSENAFRREMNTILAALSKAKSFMQRKYGITGSTKTPDTMQDQTVLSDSAKRYL